MKKSLILLLLWTPILLALTQEQKTFFAQLFKPNDLVFDVGALIGSKADLYLACNARVVCVEPQPSACKELHAKYKLNSNVAIIQKGLARIAGKLPLAVSKKARALTTFSQEWQESGRYSMAGKNKQKCIWDTIIEVPVITLDQLIASYGMPQFCKIDVENFEIEVLKGLSQPIPTLSFEIHVETLHNTQQCVECLTRIGNYEFNFSKFDEYYFSLNEWIPAHETMQIVHKYLETCSKSDLFWGDMYARLQ